MYGFPSRQRCSLKAVSYFSRITSPARKQKCFTTGSGNTMSIRCGQTQTNQASVGWANMSQAQRPQLNSQHLKDLLLTCRCHIPQQTFRRTQGSRSGAILGLSVAHPKVKEAGHQIIQTKALKGQHPNKSTLPETSFHTRSWSRQPWTPAWALQ